jgi:hypothetical protein
MKNLMIIVVTALIACNPTYKPHKITIQDDYIEVHFGRVMSKQLLDSLVNVLETKGVHLTYTSTKYDGNKLNELAFLISDGINTGTAKTNFTKIKPFGFIVDRRPGAKSRMQVGELREER